MEIKFKNNTYFEGRNGLFNCSGVDLLATHDKKGIIITPITGKGSLGRGCIVIDKDSVEEFITGIRSIVQPDKATAKLVNEITQIDPDSGLPVEIDIFKHENGGMFGVDASYLDQCFDDDQNPIINDPLQEGGKVELLT